VRARGVRDARLLAAIGEVPRARFVAPEHAAAAYEDRPLPITHDQVTTQPSLVAAMVEALGLTGGERVLEVGTGYGFQTALLAVLAGHVWTVELWPDMVDVARANLDEQGVGNVHVVLGDGTEGLPEQAPFDAIVVTAAFPRVPPPLIRQLAEDGRLIQPIGPGGSEDVMLFEAAPEGLGPGRSITTARFVPLYGRHGYARN
jgi:protein-L-isoaspartate(D-aspartate) O-methyltransferase